MVALLLDCHHAHVQQRLQLMLPVVEARLEDLEGRKMALELARQAHAFMVQVRFYVMNYTETVSTFSVINECRRRNMCTVCSLCVMLHRVR